MQSQTRAATECPAWQQLATAAQRLRATTLRQLFAADPQRYAHCSLAACGLRFDYSRQRVDGGVLDAFEALATQLELRARIDAMFRGARINTTEDRAVLHTALRRAPGAVPALVVEGQDIDALVLAERHRVLDFAERVRNGTIRSSQGAAFTLVVNIGSNRPIELLRYIEVLEQCLARKARRVMKLLQPGDVPDTYADVTELISDVGYHPDTPIEVGVRNFVDWFRDYYRIS